MIISTTAIHPWLIVHINLINIIKTNKILEYYNLYLKLYIINYQNNFINNKLISLTSWNTLEYCMKLKHN
jgi:hypothetical protein